VTMIDRNSVDFDSQIPLYMQLFNVISGIIDSGELEAGDLLPSEAELMESLKISRSTVRIALKKLEDEDRIIRRRGRGTFVKEKKVHRRLDNLYSFTKDMLEQNIQPKSKVLSFDIINATEGLCMKYGFVLDERLYSFERIRIGGNKPMLIEKTIVPTKFCKDLSADVLANNSLYTLLEKSEMLIMEKAIESYEPILMTSEQMELLEIIGNKCAFSISRTSFTDKGDVFEVTHSIMPGDRSNFEITLFSNSMEIKRSY
jgi:GntR family transcriptional regulator